MLPCAVSLESLPLPKNRGNLVEFNAAERRIHGSWTVCTTGLESRHKWIPFVANDTKHCGREVIPMVERYVPSPIVY